MLAAPVAQRIEHWPPKPGAWVRVPPGAPYCDCRIWNFMLHIAWMDRIGDRHRFLYQSNGALMLRFAYSRHARHFFLIHQTNKQIDLTINIIAFPCPSITLIKTTQVLTVQFAVDILLIQATLIANADIQE